MRGGNVMTKRKVTGVGLVCLFAMVAVACSGGSGGGSAGASATSSAPSGTLRLFSYSDGFAPAYMKRFHDLYPNVNLVTSAFGYLLRLSSASFFLCSASSG